MEEACKAKNRLESVLSSNCHQMTVFHYILKLYLQLLLPLKEGTAALNT